MPVELLLIEDQALVRHGLEALLNTLDGVRVTASVSSVTAALALLNAGHTFSLILSDYHLGNETAVDLLKRASSVAMPPLLLLSSVCHAAELQAAMAWGARGLLYKECEAAELMKAFAILLSGDVYFAAGLTGFSASPSVTPERAKPEPAVTRAEREILQWLATGMSNKEIARVLGKSAETVKAQVTQLLRKLECRTRTEAVVTASRRGWL
jgi:DNA-binding NarL/FixJ family response regulator